MRELGDIIAALHKPLDYVSKNSFANLEIVKGLEIHVMNLARQALSLPLDSEKVSFIQGLARNFTGFDSLDVSSKKIRVMDSLKVLERIKDDNRCLPSLEKEVPVTEFLKKRKELSTPIQFMKGVGPKLASLLKKKGIETVEDALYFLPRKYEDRRSIKSISKLEVGKAETVMGEIIALGAVSYKKNRRGGFEMIVGDESGTITAKWFVYNSHIKNRFKKGQKVILSGEIKVYRFQKEIHHPDIEAVNDMSDSLNFNRIVPVYSESEGLYQKTLRKIMKNIVDRYSDSIQSAIPSYICLRQNLTELSEAIREIHFPEQDHNLSDIVSGRSPAYRTIIFDEFFFLELGLALKKKGVKVEKGIAFDINVENRDRLIKSLPFSLTNAQKRVVTEIAEDMRRPYPMNRLIQGDVGSGKTIVALLSSLIAVENGYQVSIMAPTEILAEQHFSNIQHLTKKFGVKAVLLTSSIKKTQKDKILNAIKEGSINITIGTHAVIQESVEFNKLGLGVIDEQHRFGVIQRAMLKRKGYNPDILVMTATPIPRTLALTVYGDLDVSILDEMPPGRRPVVTKLYHERDRVKVYEIVRKETEKGRQAYIVYPLVEESEKLDLKDATQMAEHFQRDVFPERKIGLLHGRMGYEEKENVMLAFKEKTIDILVSTTVIEVGIDIPNASVMLIEHAERFGLSQLHQLRGRIGRGEFPSLCLLLAQYSKSDDARRRLRIMESTADGFKISEEDLAIRGPGDFMGTRQSGLPDFRVANIVRDIKVLQEARKEAFGVVERDPNLTDPSHRYLKEILKERWKGRLELACVG
ncbi:MAG: ATP-dependent DNA helicase RecG [Deltaproteobacteria bacterium]|jgi:ATP-dependent DNA helicase RecG|nr:MAG: ATP-dependent DNA helicase RecG [Deltaproteobacteria bacterium]